MLKFLFSNFHKDDNPDLVNYEKMIQYLARAQLGSAEAETVLQESVNRWERYIVNVMQHMEGGGDLVAVGFLKYRLKHSETNEGNKIKSFWSFSNVKCLDQFW